MRRLFLIALLLLPLPVMAQEAAPPPAEEPAESIVAGLSQNRVSITADFTGTELLIYGAVKREAPAPDGRLDVIITVEGPSAPLVIRRKERVAGVWINRDRARVDAAPSFYAVHTTAGLDVILSETADLRHRISIPRAIRAIGLTSEVPDPENFIDSLIRLRRAADMYRVGERQVQFTEDTLFRTDVILPANLTEGDYKVRLFLLRDGTVIAEEDSIIDVRKAGLERFLFNLSREQPLIYGLLALVLAGAMGWGASAAFRLVRA